MFRCNEVVLFMCLLVSSILTQNVTPPPPVVPLQRNEGNLTSNSTSNTPANENPIFSLQNPSFAQIDLAPFTPLAHGLRSAIITIVDPQTFLIRDLHYDGTSPETHFWVGSGTWPSASGVIVWDEKNSNQPLSAYNGQDVTLTLPGALTVDRIDYLAVYCVKFDQNIGHTLIRRKATDGSFGVELEPFKQLAHGLRSGPIIAVDKKTFFVPNLYYDGKGPDAHFWAGKGSEPSPTGVLVPDENGSSDSISEYTGQNVYITLPSNLTTDNIDYFGVWCIKFKHNFGHIIIPKNVTIPEMNGNSRYTIDNKEIIRVQKCCPLNQVLLETGCGQSSQRFNLNVSVHDHNTSHIDDEPISPDAIVFVPFVQPINCKHQKYPLDPQEEEFPLLKNGSLMVLNSRQILSLDSYCMETVNLGDQSESRWVTTAILCFSGGNAPLSSTVFIVYAVGILCSAIFLILTALVFLIIKEVRDTRGKCIVFYSGSMAAAFICLVTAQFSGIDETTCTVIGFVIQFFLVSSFTWLTMISCETYCKIIFYDSNAYSQDRRRLYIYIGVGILIPILTFVISFVIDRIPDIPNTVLKPQFGRNSCWFDDNKDSPLYFYIPVGIAIVVNIVLGILMKVKLLTFQKQHSTDIVWMTVQGELKPMFRSCVFLLTLMTVCWIMEIISFLLHSVEGVWLAIDIINSLQGVIVFIIFVAHRPVSNKICKRRKKNVETGIPLEERRAAFLNNGNRESDFEFLTKLHRADSTEFN